VRVGSSGLVPPGPLGMIPTDAGKRMSDVLSLHYLADPAGNLGRIAAIRLSDGGSDGVLYDNVADAAWAQLHYRQCAYIRISVGGWGPRECDVALVYHRKVYDAGNLPPYLQGVPLHVPTSTDWMHR
jgi:hypothetical protein